MVSSYNSRAAEALQSLQSTPGTDSQSLPTLTATVGDLFCTPPDPSLASPEFFNFDIAVSSFAFHHFADPVLSAERLAERLRPGGVLLIADFLTGGEEIVGKVDGPTHPYAHAHHHQSNEHEHGLEHNHEHQHQHQHQHQREHEHGHKHDAPLDVLDDMNASIVTHSFTAEGITAIFEKAGLVDVDVSIMKERVYLEFTGTKAWRTVFFAKGRKPTSAGKD
jgi:SAM-dependent methyltransferase